MLFIDVVYDKKMLKLQKSHNRLHRKLFTQYTHVITIEDLLSGVIN
jgi:hypothetical protein